MKDEPVSRGRRVEVFQLNICQTFQGLLREQGGVSSSHHYESGRDMIYTYRDVVVFDVFAGLHTILQGDKPEVRDAFDV